MLIAATKKTKSALKIAVVAALLCAAVAALVFVVRKPNDSSQTLRIKDVAISVEVASTTKQRAHGLCCRDFLEANAGMLFTYRQPGDYRLWMKDTRISLDMFWINNQKNIVHIEKNVQPSSYPKTFGSESPAQYLLETNAGFADKNNIHIGDNVSF